MRIFQLLLLCFIGVAKSYGQAPTKTYGQIMVEIIKENEQKVYAKVKVEKAFPGGDSAMVDSIEKALNQSAQLAKGAPKGNYYVGIQFVVYQDSSLADVRPLTVNGYGMESEVVSAFRKYKKITKWQPAPSEGRTVRPYRRSAITYKDE